MAAIINPAWSQSGSPRRAVGPALTFDILAIPFLAGTVLVWLLLARPAAPRLA